jgi:Uncharacterised nucleotidyltransferase
MPDHNPPRDDLLRVLSRPATMTGLTDAQWDSLLPRARACRCLGRMAAAARAHKLARLPGRVREHLDAVTAEAAHGERIIRWELNRIERALARLAVPVLLLKGAAYVAADLPVARGRLASDVDIMVPRAALVEVERALLEAGWQPTKLEPYDQRYYRTWMHELPPLRHSERGTFVDVHHTILPPTARLKPDPDELWSQARRLGSGCFHILAPADMVLHSAAHLFHDGDLNRSLRDLIDVGDLLGYFGAGSSFWHDLVARAAALDLGRPLFYALRYCRKLLELDVPQDIAAAVAVFAPPAPIVGVMDLLVPRALIPEEMHGSTPHAAIMLLYMRSHWLRMTPGLLMPHLTRQAVARLVNLRD